MIAVGSSLQTDRQELIFSCSCNRWITALWNCLVGKTNGLWTIQRRARAAVKELLRQLHNLGLGNTHLWPVDKLVVHSETQLGCTFLCRFQPEVLRESQGNLQRSQFALFFVILHIELSREGTQLVSTQMLSKPERWQRSEAQKHENPSWFGVRKVTRRNTSLKNIYTRSFNTSMTPLLRRYIEHDYVHLTMSQTALRRYTHPTWS